jgi:hypothetical protein
LPSWTVAEEKRRVRRLLWDETSITETRESTVSTMTQPGWRVVRKLMTKLLKYAPYQSREITCRFEYFEK